MTTKLPRAARAAKPGTPNRDEVLAALEHVRRWDQHHAVVVFTGDNSKSLLMPLMGQATQLPGVYARRMKGREDGVREERDGRRETDAKEEAEENSIVTNYWDLPETGNLEASIIPSQSVSIQVIWYDLAYRASARGRSLNSLITLVKNARESVKNRADVRILLCIVGDPAKDREQMQQGVDISRQKRIEYQLVQPTALGVRQCVERIQSMCQDVCHNRP
jgi:hypothetical protein